MTPAIITLIKRKADLTTQDKEGNTLLHYAAGMDSIEVVKLLLNAKVDPAVANRGGQVARERVSNGNRDLVELFDGPSKEACVRVCVRACVRGWVGGCARACASTRRCSA
jgi:hypothetical protein